MSLIKSLRLFYMSITWFNSWIFNGSCLWDILINMAKLSLSRAHFLSYNLTHFGEPTFDNSLCGEIIMYIASKCQMLGEATNITQSLRRSSIVTGFLFLPTAPSVFPIDFFVENLFPFFNNDLFLVECSLNSSRTLLWVDVTCITPKL